MTKPITPEEAKAFTTELSALMSKYGFSFPSATSIYRAHGEEGAMFACTELLEKLGENSRYNQFFTVHYGREGY